MILVVADGAPCRRRSASPTPSISSILFFLSRPATPRSAWRRPFGGARRGRIVDLGAADLDPELAGLPDLAEHVGRRAARPWPGCRRSSGSGRRRDHARPPRSSFRAGRRGSRRRSRRGPSRSPRSHKTIRALSSQRARSPRARRHRRAAGQLDPAQHLHQLEEQIAGGADHQQAHDQPEHVAGLDQQQGEDAGDDRQQGQKPSRRRTTGATARPARRTSRARNRTIPAAAGCSPLDLVAGQPGRPGWPAPSSAASDGWQIVDHAGRSPGASGVSAPGPRRRGASERSALAVGTNHCPARAAARRGPPAAAAWRRGRGRRTCRRLVRRIVAPRLRLRLRQRAPRSPLAPRRRRAASARPSRVLPRRASARTTAIRRAPASRTAATLPASIPPMAKNGTVRVAGGVARPARRRPPGAPAWSAWREPGRRRCSRSSRAVPRHRSAPGLRVDSPTIRLGADDPARACATGMSSCPTCTPSAPARATRSGRSLRISSAPWAAHSAAKRRAAATIRRRCPSLTRSWTMSTPPRRRCATKTRSGCASQTRYRRARSSALAKVGHGRESARPALGSLSREPTVGLRGRTLIRRPSRPDRVMPAQGGRMSQHRSRSSRRRRHRRWRDRVVDRLARRCARAGGRRLERGRVGRGTSYYAAGMLAPLAEVMPGEEPMLDLGLRSAAAIPSSSPS